MIFCNTIPSEAAIYLSRIVDNYKFYFIFKPPKKLGHTLKLLEEDGEPPMMRRDDGCLRFLTPLDQSFRLNDFVAPIALDNMCGSLLLVDK